MSLPRSYNRPYKVYKINMKKFTTLFILAVITLLPLTMNAQTETTGISACSDLAGSGFSGVVSCITGFINTAIGLIIAAAVLYIVWGAFTMIRSEEKREEGKKIIMYGIIGLFVMISIWGFVNILDRTFGLSLDASSVTIPKLIK